MQKSAVEFINYVNKISLKERCNLCRQVNTFSSRTCAAGQVSTGLDWSRRVSAGLSARLDKARQVSASLGRSHEVSTGLGRSRQVSAGLGKMFRALPPTSPTARCYITWLFFLMHTAIGVHRLHLLRNEILRSRECAWATEKLVLAGLHFFLEALYL